MIRSLVRLLGAVAFAVVLVPNVPSAAPSAGLQYDQIVRMVIGATPPPPGNFTADAAALASPVPVAVTAAPRRRGLGNLGALAGGLLSGNVAGAVTGAATDAVVGGVVDAQMDRMIAASAGAFAGALRGLTQGRLERHSFYAGWERVDDVAAQTATITKCDMHQYITLDLAKKTYTMTDPTAVPEETAAPAPRRSRRSEPAAPAQAPDAPGTAVADFSTVVTPLGARRFDGIDATGYTDATTFAVTQATGSCKNGTFAFNSKAYYSRLPTPRLVCPLVAPAVTRERYPEQPRNFVASGGCRPTFSAHHSGPVPPLQYLPLYQTIAVNGMGATAATPDPSSSPAPGFVFLTERGNVHSLTAANASLFEVPADFTKAP